MGRKIQGALPLASPETPSRPRTRLQPHCLKSITGSTALRSPYAFTGAAATVDAPFIDLDTIDLFLLSGKDDAKLRQLDQRPESGRKLRFIYPYDSGVFLYARTDGSVPMVSNIQAYLDLYARGGRDLKQAAYL